MLVSYGTRGGLFIHIVWELGNLISSNSFKNMSDKEWDQITDVHLKGAFSCTKAAWPLFRKQKFGRVINTASAAGLYGMLPSRTKQNQVTKYWTKAILARPTIALQRWVLSVSL